MAISAAVDGLGVCLDGLSLAEQELRTGKLIIPFAGDIMLIGAADGCYVRLALSALN